MVFMLGYCVKSSNLNHIPKIPCCIFNFASFLLCFAMECMLGHCVVRSKLRYPIRRPQDTEHNWTCLHALNVFWGGNSLKCHKIYEKGHKEVKNVTALKMFSGDPKLILFSFLCVFFWSYSSSQSRSWSWQLPQ